MFRNVLKLTFATLTFMAMSAMVTQAAITTTTPSYTTSTIFEARGTIGQPGNWKNAIWTGGNYNKPTTQGSSSINYADGSTYSWSLSYDVNTGLVNWSVGEFGSSNVTDSMSAYIAASEPFVGFKIYANAKQKNSTGISTVVDNIQLSYNDGLTRSTAVPDQVSTSETFYYFDTNNAVDSFTLTGDVTFDWDTSSGSGNHRGERFKFGIKGLQGTPGAGGNTGTVIPSPAAVWGGLTLIGYAVMRRTRKNQKAEQA